MVEDWISQANARQRRGRAGRVKPGICFCLYTCYRFEKCMRPFQVLSVRKKKLQRCICSCSFHSYPVNWTFLPLFFFSCVVHNAKVPEMLRMPLVELCLQIKLLSLGYVKPFLSMVSNAMF
jgi:ATP-dependent RNA helicase DHX29